MSMSADFETVNNIDDCRVWLWGIMEIGNTANFKWGKSIDSFMEHVKSCEVNLTIYFHNLKFDGTFIMCWLFEHGFTHQTDYKKMEGEQFSTLISDTGQFYSMDICFYKFGKKKHTVKLLDSLKILPFSVKEIAKAFSLPVAKGEIDYNKNREVGYEPTAEELEYQRIDVEIVARAIEILQAENLQKMTVGSNALYDYKQIVTPKKFEKWFPVPDYDSDIRQSYKGGFTYVKPSIAGKDIGEGIVLDVNSLYPSVMAFRNLPYGDPIYYIGQCTPDKTYNMYIQQIRCQFRLKPRHIPCIALKNLQFAPLQYLTYSAGEDVVLTLTNVDLELFFKHYNVYNIEYIAGWKFKSTVGLFADYIDKWHTRKIEAKQTGNKAQATIAKLMLNSLYGKFSTNPKVRSKIPYYEKGAIKYEQGEESEREPVYLPVGTFITSWARFTCISAAQKLYDRFLYADTDSLHLRGLEIPNCIEVHPSKLGAWKHEYTFSKARYLHAKCYVEFGKEPGDDKEALKITVAGLPSRCYEGVTWDNFKPGAEYGGKLQHKNVAGGIVLGETEFTIK